MHSIQSVSERTGLSADVIRIWERRYSVVNPQRTPSNQRLYTDDDVEHLALLKRVTDSGRRISAIAHLSTEDLKDIVAKTSVPPIVATPAAPSTLLPEDVKSLRAKAIEAILELESRDLTHVLDKALIQLGGVAFMTQFIAPLLEQVGNLWRSGSVRTSQEHFASAHVRSFLGKYLLTANTDPLGPRIVMCTLPGQLHELGALMSSVVAAQGGWNVIYLGASVPIEEIQFTVDCKEARAVGISLNYPIDDPRIEPMLQELKSALRENTELLVGGIGARRHQAFLQRIAAKEINSLDSLPDLLDSLR